jgi:tetratricopeptide (TPR) repeat protein
MVRNTSPVARIHASHPSLQQNPPAPRFARPPRPNLPPTSPRGRGRDRRVQQHDTRDDQEEDNYHDLSQNPSFTTLHKKNDHIIQTIEEALVLEKTKLGIYDPSVTHTLHSLALEYKLRGRYEKAIEYLKEALDLLNQRLPPSFIMDQGAAPTSVGGGERENYYTNGEDDDASSMHSGSIFSSSNYTHNNSSISQLVLHEQEDVLEILEEKSVLFACLGNIYKLRRMYKEAGEYYVQSINMLVEADYEGDSPRVAMMVRILKRTESERMRRSRGRSRSNSRTRSRGRSLSRGR